MNVFDGDPSKLSWKSGNGKSTVLGLFKPGAGFIKETAISGRVPPTDEEFEDLLHNGKKFSTVMDSTVFVVMRRIKKDSEENDRLTPFAEYYKGTLVAFCRPPWRRGESIA